MGVRDFIFIFSKVPKSPSFTFLLLVVFLAGGFTLAVCFGVFFFFELVGIIFAQKSLELRLRRDSGKRVVDILAKGYDFVIEGRICNLKFVLATEVEVSTLVFYWPAAGGSQLCFNIIVIVWSTLSSAKISFRLLPGQLLISRWMLLRVIGCCVSFKS